MDISGDNVRTLLTIVAISISVASLYFARRSWFQSNRPIVTAFVAECGDLGTVFNLVVANTGNRPATRISLHATPEDIASLTDMDASDDRKCAIAKCFSEKATIPLLRNGEELETAFGAFSNNPTDGTWLNYATQIQIEISYSDLDGRNYTSHLPLRIYARKGFGGSLWN